MNSSPGSRMSMVKIKYKERGRIKDIKNIIVRITGLGSCLNGQIVDFGNEVKGIVMGFDENDVLALALGDASRLRMGQEVTGVSEPFTVPVGSDFVGRMVDALCQPCDGGTPIVPDCEMPVFAASHSITERDPVDQFLHTGTKAIDALVPIGKGQRQLLIGDRMTGKTTVAMDAIVNQKDRGVICVYCCIGKSVSSLEKVISVFKDTGALAYTTIMASTDNSPPGEQYLAPFVASTLGDFFACRGRDVLIVFDDLTKHAWAYRQLSLLLERSPGREAYPGDIFYVQTQLMERAGRLNKKSGGGSMTFFGITETLQGDLTGYIPSNLISMCDGQVCFSTTMFGEGMRPAIDFGLSVSIIGGKAQPPLLRELSRTLRADYQRYSELVKLSRLQTNLSGEAEAVLARGEALLAVLQQGQHVPVGLAETVALLYALEAGRLLKLSRDDRARFGKEYVPFLLEKKRPLLEQIARGLAAPLTPELRRGLDAAMEEFIRAPHD